MTWARVGNDQKRRFMFSPCVEVARAQTGLIPREQRYYYRYVKRGRL